MGIAAKRRNVNSKNVISQEIMSPEFGLIIGNFVSNFFSTLRSLKNRALN